MLHAFERDLLTSPERTAVCFWASSGSMKSPQGSRCKRDPLAVEQMKNGSQNLGKHRKANVPPSNKTVPDGI